MLSRSKPFRDNEELSNVCPRCMSSNSIINQTGNSCSACNYPFIKSSISFENLPLVEFRVDPSLSKDQVLSMIGTNLEDHKKNKSNKQNYEESGWEEENKLTLDEKNITQSKFMKKVIETCQYQMNKDKYISVELDNETLRTLIPEDL